MQSETRIYINNDLDIVLARMQTREMAKNMGFGTADQARISLAAAELARVQSWTRRDPGEMVIANTSKNGHQGLQVIGLVLREHLAESGISAGPEASSIPGRSLAGARRLVDESRVDVQSEHHAQVTLIKWLK